MDKKLDIGIDFDLTLVDSDYHWVDWMEKVYNCKIDWTLPPDNPQKVLYYNLSKYFPEDRLNKLSPYEFWEDPYLYDKVQPKVGAVEAIKRLHDAGHNIHVISYCKKGHFSSKVRHLKHHYPFLDLDNVKSGNGFYATKNKGSINVNLMIDDRNDYLNQFKPDVVKILFSTPYEQFEDLESLPDLVTSDWKSIADYILEDL